ncbi:MAG: DUF2306 domain-containing protein [Ferrovibrio sp.]|jgi:uncharacterized membrane protein|nr:DUF2306 domain-containing protein [Ferrovibrio sp.]
MTLAPLLAASPAIQLHVASTLSALVLGTIVLLRPKGTGPHKVMGWGFILLMLTASGSSLFIREIFPGSFSPIHILSITTPVGMAAAIYAARRGNFYWHRRAMLLTYWSGLILAGVFTLLPGRILGRVLFGG